MYLCVLMFTNRSLALSMILYQASYVSGGNSFPVILVFLIMPIFFFLNSIGSMITQLYFNYMFRIVKKCS